MAKWLLQIGRSLSEHRIAAYECAMDGSTVSKEKRVCGWYGMFDEQRLQQEIVPKLAEYVGHGASYPFLITSYMLESKADVRIEGTRPRQDVKFRPRRRRTSQQYEAIVHTKTKYQLLR